MLNGESVFVVTESTEDKYNYTLFWICLTMTTTSNLSLPFFDWTSASKFVKFLRSWIAYQENYTLKSGRVLRMKHKQRIRIIFCMDLLVLDSKTKSAHRISDYRRLWLELMDITTSFSDLMSYKMTHTIFISFIFVIVSSYHMALSVLSRGVSSSGDIFLYFFCSLYTAGHMLCACESGHRVAQSLGKNFLDRATRFQLQTQTLAEQKEFNLFMSIVRRRSPSIHLNGFLTVDRSLIVHVISGSLAYLIILVQFKVGMSESDRIQYKNITELSK
ncbi:hypothetical protein LSTR_LSTR009684 [Laodelphax striatellus]|uniref:Gustatory receptor n=1 Tax=Laodelphax striatellus TaxID=195883 RepID=A0A482WPD9_LAOST|nr:hypothetical protein LSTR_LSTR009684 [Laodelphax striatellus]